VVVRRWHIPAGRRDASGVEPTVTGDAPAKADNSPIETAPPEAPSAPVTASVASPPPVATPPVAQATRATPAATNAAATPPPSAVAPPRTVEPRVASESAPVSARTASRDPPPARAALGPVLQPDPVPQWQQEADAAQRAGDWARAQRIYEEWLRQRPDDALAASGLAAALHHQQQWPQALLAYQRAVRLWPDNTSLRSGALAVLAHMDPEQAESRLRDWLLQAPEDATAHAALGTLLARQQRWALARDPLERAVAIAPHHAPYHYNLALVYDRLQRTADALRHYRRALALGDPQLPEREIRQRIATLTEEASDADVVR
jgi:Flp pilus assembly protein TadD